MNTAETVLDLPLEKQQELAKGCGMSLEEWREDRKISLSRLDAHKITGYFDEETSARLEAKMLSGTPRSQS